MHEVDDDIGTPAGFGGNRFVPPAPGRFGLFSSHPVSPSVGYSSGGGFAA